MSQSLDLLEKYYFFLFLTQNTSPPQKFIFCSSLGQQPTKLSNTLQVCYKKFYFQFKMKTLHISVPYTPFQAQEHFRQCITTCGPEFQQWAIAMGNLFCLWWSSNIGTGKIPQNWPNPDISTSKIPQNWLNLFLIQIGRCFFKFFFSTRSTSSC